jgi:hypothetical protein
MHEILDLMEQTGVTLRLARVKPAVRVLLERDRVLARIGDDRIHEGVAQAVEAQMAAASTPPHPDRGVSAGEASEDHTVA